MSEKEPIARPIPIEVVGDTKDLFEIVYKSNEEFVSDEEGRLISPEEAAKLCVGNDEVVADIELDLIHRWIIEEQVPFIRHPDGVIKLPMQGFLVAMGKLTGIEEEVNKMLEPSSMDLLQDAVWRPDWLK